MEFMHKKVFTLDKTCPDPDRQ